MQRENLRPMILSVVSIGLLAVGSAAAAENHHHKNGADDETPIVEGAGMMPDMGGMPSMSEMGGSHMAMMQMHMSMMSQMTTNSQIKALFKDSAPDAALSAFDGNGDGMMDIEEFAAWDSQALRNMMVDRFQKLDADGSGGVSLEELQAASVHKSGMGPMNGMGGLMGNMDGMAGNTDDMADGMDPMKEAEGSD